MNVIRNLLNRYVYQDWNIAIADIADDFKSCKHQMDEAFLS